MLQKIIIFTVLIATILVDPVHANPISSDSNVSATVTSFTFNAPILVSPTENSSTNSARVTFHWKRPSPLPVTTLDHYDLYIDNAVYASSVSDTTSTLEYYFYTVSRDSEKFYVALKQDLAQGYHTWKVAAFDTIGTNAITGNWTFYIDSITPFISLTKINSTDYTWNTSVSGSIPEESLRYIDVNANNPTIKGNVETNANLQISLVCPSSPPASCTNQSWIINSTDGNWEKQFSNLITNIYYTVNLSATDALSNTTVFPSFYLKYATTVTPTATATPKVTSAPTSTPTLTTPKSTPTNPPLTISSKLTPPPDLAALITPTAYIPKTPPAPTIPPQVIIKPKIAFAYGPYILFFFLLLGLPTHLIMTSIAVGSNLKNLLPLLITLGFPFLKRKNTTTIPFSFVEVFDLIKLSKPLYKTISDINGNLYFPDKFPVQVFVTLKNVNRVWKDQIMPNFYLTNTCLFPTLKRSLGAKEELQNTLYSLRTIPIIIAIITSTVGVYFYPNAYLITYLYLSLQYTFSEYFYPQIWTKINRDPQEK